MADNNSEQQFMLPAPSAAEDDAKKLNLAADGESSIKLDELGPMVVNSDGTLSRIANWVEMTDAERANTLRVLSARNKIRLAKEVQKQNIDAADSSL